MVARFSRALALALLAVTSQGARLRAQNASKANSTAPTTLIAEKTPTYPDYIVKPCIEVCGKAGAPGKDSHCVTRCEAEMYRCHDHNSTRLDEAMDWRQCHDATLGKFQTYRPNLAFGARRQIVKPCAEACANAGEAGDESSCYSMCETEMFQCHDHNHTVATAEFDACHDAVVAKFEAFASDPSMLLASEKGNHNLVQQRQIVKPCKDACAKAGVPGDESSCLTMCEAEMFHCHDHNHTVATAEFQACQNDVVVKYETYRHSV